MPMPPTRYNPPWIPGNILITDQPDPIPNDYPAAWDLVLMDVGRMFPPEELDTLKAEELDTLASDMRARDELGQERYNTSLQPHNGRNSLVDAYQEALDLCVYLRVAIYELPEEVAFLEQDRLLDVYDSSLKNALSIRSLLTAREER